MRKTLPHHAIALRKAREAAGLSQYSLSDVSGVSRPAIAGIELGRHSTINLKTAKKLADALGIDVSTLVEPPASRGRDQIERFLRSAWAMALEITDEEVNWLRNLPQIQWRGQPTDKTYYHLIEALRESEKQTA